MKEELAIPPQIKLEQAKGFSLYAAGDYQRTRR